MWWRVGAVLLGIAIAVLSFVGCGVAQEGTPPPTTAGNRPTFTVGLTYQPDIQFAPFYVADALGWAAAAEHATFELRHHGTSEALFGALATGNEDLVVAGGDEMYLARGEGIALTSVFTMYRNYPVAIIVPGSAPVQSCLTPGSSVGIPGPYGENWYYLKAALLSCG
ncbi:MAG: ABC transporter substrate-binding protein, partial [Propionibacteriaceae bacterium]|nr:ABC transporter substrate-binding protein [Propionibacteriaceae bacterium]